MRISEALHGSGIERSDAEILLSALMHVDRAHLHAHPEYQLSLASEDSFVNACSRRRAGEPIAYILGERSFYGKMFRVDGRVHIPRPSTENLVSQAIAFLDHRTESNRQLEPGVTGYARVLRNASSIDTLWDLGTGSGCIAITLALLFPQLRIVASDIEQSALDVASMNAQQHGVLHRIAFRHSRLLASLRPEDGQVLVISNPPYIPDGKRLPDEVVSFEPSISLRGGIKGDSIIREVLCEMKAHEQCMGYVIECLDEHIGIFPPLAHTA